MLYASIHLVLYPIVLMQIADVISTSSTFGVTCHHFADRHCRKPGPILNTYLQHVPCDYHAIAGVVSGSDVV